MSISNDDHKQAWGQKLFSGGPNQFQYPIFLVEVIMKQVKSQGDQITGFYRYFSKNVIIFKTYILICKKPKRQQ